MVEREAHLGGSIDPRDPNCVTHALYALYARHAQPFCIDSRTCVLYNEL